MPSSRSTWIARIPEFVSLTVTLIFGLAVVSTFTGCSGDSKAERGNGGERLIPAVEAVRAKQGSLPLTERMNGLVKAKNQVELYPQVSAVVTQVLAQNGDFVKAGQRLVRLRDTELKEQLKQAEASLQIALAQAKQAEAEAKRMQSELGRSTTLSEQNLISPTEFESIQTDAVAAEADADLARARIDQAQANVDERKEALSRTIITAPVAGTVGNRNAEIGMFVTPNTKLFTLGQLDTVRVEVILTDRMLGYIKEKQRTEISSPELSFGTLEAPLARISPFLHPVTHSTKGEIDVPNDDRSLKPGMFVSVDIFYGESEQATLIPLSAIWENQATASVGVYVCQDSITGEQLAQVDDPTGGSLTNPLSFLFVPIEVIARGRMSAGVRGVKPGSWVVTVGQDLLGENEAKARVRPIDWKRIEQQQKLQREDLLQDLIEKQKINQTDTGLSVTPTPGSGTKS